MFENFFYDFVKITGIPALVFMAPLVRFSSDEAKKAFRHGGVLVVSNHVSFSDPVTIIGVCMTRRPVFIATKDLFRGRLMSFFFRHVGCIEVDKDNFSVDTFHGTVNALKSGKVVCIFPEGSVHRGEDVLLDFHDGAVLMAWKAGVKVVPVYISTKKHWYSHPYVYVGDPVDVSSAGSRFPNPAKISQLTGQIRSTVEKFASDFAKGRTKK